MIVNDYDRLREIMTHFAENAIDPEGSYNPQKVRKGSSTFMKDQKISL